MVGELTTIAATIGALLGIINLLIWLFVCPYELIS